MTRWTRRALLRSAAATVALPLLPSLLPARADGASPARLVFWFCPNGMNMADFTPATAGTGWELTPILAPLAGVRDEVCVLSGLANLAAIDAPTGDHPRGTASFLSAAHVEQGRVAAGVSVDQVAAATADTAFPSLQLKLADRSGTCDPGYSCVYNDTISWASPTTPLPALTSPAVVFDRMFAGALPGPSEADRARRAAIHTSILDHVLDQAGALRGRVSADDRARVDAYLTAVRELEVRVQRPPGPACQGATRPVDSDDVERAMDAMTDLMVLALRCDLTRYVTFMQGNGGSSREFGHIGVDTQHHAASHHMNDPVKLDQLTRIGAWEVGWYARLLEKLRDTPDGAGSLLDSCLVMLGSEISDGNDHTHRDMPVLLGGRGCGRVTPGRHLVAPGAPVAELYVAMLEVAGVEVAGFGVDGHRPLPGLLS